MYISLVILFVGAIALLPGLFAITMLKPAEIVFLLVLFAAGLCFVPHYFLVGTKKDSLHFAKNKINC